jgi:ribonucleoside-diphosphate reductase alpha chain
MPIRIDTSADSRFDELGLKRLKDSYMRPEETSPQQRFAYVCERMSSNPEHAQRLYAYASSHWLSFSTPILSFGKAKHGLPISCYLSYLPDTSRGLLDTLAEVNQLSMLGGGVGVGVKIRSADEKSTGVMPHLNTYDASCLAYKQDGVRRGSYAVYLDINHPEIIPFLEMRKATGDHNIRCQNLHHAINISDEFMRLIEKCVVEKNVDDRWELRDPHTREIKSVISARQLWQRILETRMKTGEPYLCFIDTCNRLMPAFQRDKGLSIAQSNLCSEITLPTDENRTAVCCLSSLNLEKYHEWKLDALFVRDVAEMLDNALELFIQKAPKSISRAIYSAQSERSIGIGALGWHALLQSMNIAIESAEARDLNVRIFADIKSRVDIANLELGASRGEPPDAIGTGRRFCCAIAIAPNATSSIIMGNTSPSIEPFRANAYRQDTLSGSWLNKNKYLDRLLKTKSIDIDRVWNEIIMNSGSVQQLSCLTDHEKAVFKTAFEIDQNCLIRLAADRQAYIDQSQSLNLFLPPKISVKLLHSLHFDAWKLGLKTLYYCRSTKMVEADKLIAPASGPACSKKRGTDGQVCVVCE